jgi:hypothetical protein
MRLVLSFFVLLSSSVSFAQPDVVAMKLNGYDGVWMPLPVAQHLLLMYKEYQDLQEQYKTLGDLLVKKDEAIVTLSKEIDDCKALQDSLSKQVLVEQKARKAAEEAANKWYKNPYLFFAAGVLVTSATVITIKYR